MYVTILRIGKVCQKWNVPSVIANSRLVQDFDTKIWILNQALAKAKTQGRTNGKYLTWKFRIYYNRRNSWFWQRACLEQMSRLRGQFFDARLTKITIVWHMVTEETYLYFQCFIHIWSQFRENNTVLPIEKFRSLVLSSIAIYIHDSNTGMDVQLEPASLSV